MSLCTNAYTDSLSEILLIGTGKTMMPLPPFLKDYCRSLGIQLDVMDTVQMLPLLLQTQYAYSTNN